MDGGRRGSVGSSKEELEQAVPVAASEGGSGGGQRREWWQVESKRTKMPIVEEKDKSGYTS